MPLTHVSSSQIKDFKACNRLWYYTRVLGQRPPQTEAQSRGTTVHGALEAHLKAGKIEPEILERAQGLGISVEDLSEYVAAMEPFVGKPGEGLTEYRDEMPTYDGGPKFVLVVDHAREVEVGGRVIPQIDDLKTTSDFRYCKTPDELSKDIQMVSYAKWALWRLFELQSKPPPDFVSLRHVYVRTRGKRVATARDVLVTPVDVEARWFEILDHVRDMSTLADMGKEIDPQIVPATTTDHCSAYGGCHFRAQCFGDVYDKSRPFLGLFKKETKESVMADTNGVAQPRTSLKDRVAARKAAAGGAPAPVAPAVVASAPAVVASAPAVVASAPAVVASVPATVPNTTVCGVAHAAFPMCLCTLVQHEGDHESKSPAGGVIHWSQDGSQFGIGPSQNWKPLVAIAPAASAAAPTAASVVASFAPGAVPQVLPPDAPPRTSTSEEVATTSAPARGRPRKKTTEAAATPAATPATTPAVAPTTVSATPSAAVVLEGSPVPAVTPVGPVVVPGVVCPLKELYVDAWPVKGVGGAIGLGEDLLHSLSADAAKAANTPDWRLVEFGKGKGAMAVLLRERLASVPEILVVSSSTPGSDVLIEVLSPHARRVVRALRG